MTNNPIANESDTGFQMQALPAVLQFANHIADKFTDKPPVLTPENLIQKASRRANLPARFPDHVEIALEVLCSSLRDDAPQLHWFGKMNQFDLIVTGLAEFLLVEEIFRRQPELNAVKLNNPLIITGIPRSGTTFLHRLLASMEEAQSIPLYRHLFPTPRRLPTRLLEAAILFEPWRWANRAYQIDAIHYVRPWLSDECNFGMRLTLRSSIFWSTTPTYKYLNWLLEQNLRETYHFYRKVLILHQIQVPNRRLTLKCPHHLTSLPALSEALPEARIIQTHRDPLETTPSECSLIVSLQALSVSSMDWRKTIKHNYRKVVIEAERSIDFAESTQGQNVLHVPYRRLIQDPIKLAAEVHEHFGLTWDQSHQSKLETFYSANRQHKHGKHRYSLAQFELSPEKINADFKKYRERFLLI